MLRAFFTWPIFLSAALLQRVIGSGKERIGGSWAHRLVYAEFAKGVPAILFAALTASFGVVAWLGADGLESAYRVRALAALKADDAAEAIVCLQRLAAMQPSDRQVRFSMALAYEQAGDAERATALIRSLAPDDEAGYGPAQLAIVRRALATPTEIDVRRLREIEARLIRLRQQPDVGPEAALLLARLYLTTGRAAFVLNDPDLTAVAESDPELRLRLIQARVGRLPAATLRLHAQQSAEYFRGLLKKSPEDRTARLCLAQAQVLLGDFSSAVTTLREGLTLHADHVELKATLAAVAVAQARTVVATGGSPEARRRACVEAIHALQSYAPPGDATSSELAHLHRLIGDYGQAEKHYRGITERSPAARMDLAELLQAIGRGKEAESEYAAVLRGYDEATPEHRNRIDYRILAATAALRLGKFAEAEALLKPSMADSPAAKLVLLRNYVTWSDSLAKTDSARRLMLLREALKLEPFYPPALQQLIDLAAGDRDSAAAARTMLGEMIARGDAPASAYFLLGNDALLRGDGTAALKYLEQAQRLEPELPATMNNLAWALAFGENPNLDRALELSNAAVLKAPQDLRIRDTRGRILAKLGRWQEAIADLEPCAAKMDGDADFHAAIADVYERLGLKAPAAGHRKRIEQLQAETKK